MFIYTSKCPYTVYNEAKCITIIIYEEECLWAIDPLSFFEEKKKREKKNISQIKLMLEPAMAF